MSARQLFSWLWSKHTSQPGTRSSTRSAERPDSVTLIYQRRLYRTTQEVEIPRSDMNPSVNKIRAACPKRARGGESFGASRSHAWRGSRFTIFQQK